MIVTPKKEAPERPAPRYAAPLRRVVSVGAGTSDLECGHIIDTTSRMRNWNASIKGKECRARCVTCLRIADRERAERARSSE